MDTNSLFTWSKWLFWRAGFFLANQSSLKSFDWLEIQIFCLYIWQCLKYLSETWKINTFNKQFLKIFKKKNESLNKQSWNIFGNIQFLRSLTLKIKGVQNPEYRSRLRQELAFFIRSPGAGAGLGVNIFACNRTPEQEWFLAQWF